MATALPKHLYRDGNPQGEVRYVRNEEEEAVALRAGFQELTGFHEYPKHLHKDGDREQESLVVKDKKEEDAARKKGFGMIGETKAEAKK